MFTYTEPQNYPNEYKQQTVTGGRVTWQPRRPLLKATHYRVSSHKDAAEALERVCVCVCVCV